MRWGGVSVSFCCVTNHPETLWLQTANIYLTRSSVGWHLGLASSGWFCGLSLGFADLSWACSCVCGQLGGGAAGASWLMMAMSGAWDDWNLSS